MKKAFFLGILSVLFSTHAALGHSAEVMHMHPHGENAYLTTWLVAVALGLALGGRFLLKRLRQN